MPPDTMSKHRHISFTAHYTGYIWYQMGLSHPQLATEAGRMYAAMLEPMECWTEFVYGNSIRKTLITRHTMLDDALTQLLAQYPDAQVLEIAAGLSPRGWRFRQQNSDLVFKELDLPNMAAIKQGILDEIEPTAPKVLALDILGSDWQSIVAEFDTSKPLLIVSEGLINYFEPAVLQRLLARLLQVGQAFPCVHYLTDLYPQPLNNQLAMVFWGNSHLLKWMSHSEFGFHFRHPAAVRDFFAQAGWQQVSVLQPKQLAHAQGARTEAVDVHLGDLVWMVHAHSTPI